MKRPARLARRPPLNPRTVFERVCVINLDRRPDRWREFLERLPADWPFAPPTRVSAVDGTLCPPPDWWRPGAGAWGCYRSHARVIEQALCEGVSSLLILEDDATFPPDFTPRALSFLGRLPPDWQMLYLGGQHLRTRTRPPTRLAEDLYRPFNVNRTHAYALRGDMREVVYRHLNGRDWRAGHHIDHHYGRLHMEQRHRIYCPAAWLVGQDEGRSDIAARAFKTRFWPAAESLAGRPAGPPFVAVVGLHSSGSSCLAGVLYHLGLHLGNKFVGFYGRDPGGLCGFEAEGLARICEEAVPFPATELALPPEAIRARLAKWIGERACEAAEKETLAAGKYPLLCALGEELVAAAGPGLRAIHVDRPLEDSIASLVRREPGRDAAEIERHQRWLDEGKRRLLGQVDHLTVAYADLLSDPRREIDRILAYLGHGASPEQVEAAAAYVRPELRHVTEAGRVTAA